MRRTRSSIVMAVGASLFVGLISAPAWAGDWQRAAAKDQVAGCSMAAFVDPQFKGPSWKTRNSWAVVGWEFDSKISSIKVHSGIWQLFRDANFQGQIETLYPGNYGKLRPSTANLIRSFRCVRST